MIGGPGRYTPGAADDLLSMSNYPGRTGYREEDEPLIEEKKVKRIDFGVSEKALTTVLMALLMCFVVPSFIFIITYYARSMWIRHGQPELSFGLTVWCFVLILCTGAAAFGAKKKRSDYKFAVLLFGLCVVAYLLAVIGGDHVFDTYTKVYYDLRMLQTYDDVSPQVSGQSFMDAGVIEFTKDSKIGTHFAMGFKDGDVYCVAPVVKTGNETTSPISFWAVGMNCCSIKVSGDFWCGESYNDDAHSGLRLVREDQRLFYRLAVEKAEAEYDVVSKQPVFLHWMQNPTQELKQMYDDYVASFAWGTMAYIVFHIIFLTLITIVLSKTQSG